MLLDPAAVDTGYCARPHTLAHPFTCTADSLTSRCAGLLTDGSSRGDALPPIMGRSLSEPGFDPQWIVKRCWLADVKRMWPDRLLPLSSRGNDASRLARNRGPSRSRWQGNGGWLSNPAGAWRWDPAALLPAAAIGRRWRASAHGAQIWPGLFVSLNCPPPLPPPSTPHHHPLLAGCFSRVQYARSRVRTVLCNQKL